MSFALLLSAVAASPLAGQEPADTGRVTVSGTVVDRHTRLPIRNAFVRLPEVNVVVLSDETGRFVLRDIRRGVYEMVIRAPGYAFAEGDFRVDRPGSFEVALTAANPDREGRGSIIGYVADRNTGEPLASVAVAIPSLGLGRLTDDRGWFDLGEIPAGATVIRTSSLGHRTREDSVHVSTGETLELTIPLATEPIALEAITVTVRSRFLETAGFFRRQGRGYSGRQWTAEEIEREDPVFVQDLVTQVPGVRRGRTRTGEMTILGRRGCRLSLYIDDVLMAGFDLDHLEPRNIQALEVYHGTPAEMPVEYGFRHCGVILVWLRH